MSACQSCNTHTHPFNRPLSSTTSIGKMLNCGMWNAEGKMRNDKCGTTVIGPQVRPQLLRSVPHAARGWRSGKLRNPIQSNANKRTQVFLFARIFYNTTYKLKHIRFQLTRNENCKEHLDQVSTFPQFSLRILPSIFCSSAFYQQPLCNIIHSNFPDLH